MGTCVNSAYIGLETFKCALEADILLPEQYHEDWPYSIPDYQDGKRGWTYEFEGCTFYLSNPHIKGKELGYMNEGEFRELFPKLATFFDEGLEERKSRLPVGLWG